MHIWVLQVKYVPYCSGAAATVGLMCLRMDMLTVRRRKRRRRREVGGDSTTVAVHQQRWDHSHYITGCTDRHTLHFYGFHIWSQLRFRLRYNSASYGGRVGVAKSVQMWRNHNLLQLSLFFKPAWLKGNYVYQPYPSCFWCQINLQWATVCVSLVLTQMLWNTDCPVTALHSQNKPLQLITVQNNSIS